MQMPIRCPWPGHDPVYQAYHDNEWGRVETDSKALFAKLCLDGQQAGLSWITILKKQKNFEQAFFQFEPEKIALMGEADVDKLMTNSGIIRHRLKIQAVIKNARAYLEIERQGQSFSDFIWQFVEGKTICNRWHSMAEVPTETPASIAMSKALKKAGMSFVGPTICYAFMQAVGMVNDHLVSCHCHAECEQHARR